MIKRLTHNWLAKLVSVALAMVAWYFILINIATTSQRNLDIPVSVVGLEQTQTISEIIDQVKITVSGESRQVDRLVPENFTATLNVAGLSGNYEQKIEVIPPQGIKVESVSPEISIGTIESISSKEVPVSIVFLPGQNANSLLSAAPAQQTVTVQGRESILGQVTKVTGFVPAQPGEVTATLFATDSNFNPINNPLDVSLKPSSLSVIVTSEAILHVKPVVLNIDIPEFEGFFVKDFEVSQSVVSLAGTQELLEPLEQINGIITPPEVLEARTYTLPVTIALPANISALQTVSAQFTLEAINPLANPE